MVPELANCLPVGDRRVPHLLLVMTVTLGQGGSWCGWNQRVWRTSTETLVALTAATTSIP